MQEDKTSKWLASELRKRQEEDPLPYELGAWEAFAAKRAKSGRKKTTYWLSGIAAAVALLLVAGGLWIAQDTTETGSLVNSGQIALEEKSESGTELHPNTTEETPSQHSMENLAMNEVGDAGDSQTGQPNTPQNIQPSSQSRINSNVKTESLPAETPAFMPTTPVIDKALSKSPEVKINEHTSLNTSPEKPESSPKSAFQNSLAAKGDSLNANVKSSPDKKEETFIAALPKDPQLDEEEIQEILESKSFARLAMGVSPGFGASQNSEMATSGSSLGVGVMVDMEITGRLVMGSGLAVNYLNQSSESQSYNTGGGFYATSAVTEVDEISQVQVDIPLYVKYPITRNQAISLQAGFSNLITFNQSAAHESSYSRQVAVMDANSSSSFSLKSEAVSMSQDLSVPSQKFYPLATANFGVNIRVFESKKTSYEVMPFYNYPLQEFSGYGQRLGMFGASFKVNFGAIQKK